MDTPRLEAVPAGILQGQRAQTRPNSPSQPSPGLQLHVVTAGVILDDGGRLLIARRAPGRYIPGLWEFPGGKLEPDESPEACLARELMEELGLEVKVGELLTAVHHTYDRYRVLLLAYRCALASPGPSPGTGLAAKAPAPLTDEHDRVEWVDPRTVLGSGEYELLEADRPILRRLLETDRQRASTLDRPLQKDH